MAGLLGKKVFVLVLWFIAFIPLPAVCEVWKFGLIADSQWPAAMDDGRNPNAVAVDIINQINAEFIKQKVKLVVAVGDLTDNGWSISLDTRATYCQALYNAGIGFYPLRGNHEPSSASAMEFLRIFPQTQNGVNNKTPVDAFIYTDSSQTHPAKKKGGPIIVGTGFSSPSVSLKGLSYAFTYKNATFILLDQFDVPDNTPNAIKDQQPWITKVLRSRKTNSHAFVFGHKGLIMQHHEDVFFGDNPTVDSAATNTFIRSLTDNKVHFLICGHDHLHNRALISATDGCGKSIQQIILSGGSYKFYQPPAIAWDEHWNVKVFGREREIQISQELYHIGYYIVTIDENHVTADYFAVPSGQIDGVITTTPKLTGQWTKRERFGYDSRHGKEFLIPRASSYMVVSDTFSGTKARILSGTNTGSVKDQAGRWCNQYITCGWKFPQFSDMFNCASAIFTLWGMNPTVGAQCGPPYCLSIGYYDRGFLFEILRGRFGLITKTRDGRWINAVESNSIKTKKWVIGPYVNSYPLGTYGVDTATHSVWAVIDYDADFAAGRFSMGTDNIESQLLFQQRASSAIIIGNKLIIPRSMKDGAGTMNVDFIALNGRVLFQAVTQSNTINIAALQNKLSTQAILLRWNIGKQSAHSYAKIVLP
ncbi:MAG: metallophosphoesterase [Chitinivibrionales bacterium]|nr:metallophosphoesterase [Chitinivibrionales bacterium]